MTGQKESDKANGQKKGFWAILKESIAKSNDGCGPGCGCHAPTDKKADGAKIADDGKKR